MTRFRLAARRLSIILRKASRHLARMLPDAHVYVGVGAIAYGASLILPAPFGPGAGFIVLGLGLIWIVRFGAETAARRR